MIAGETTEANSFVQVGPHQARIELPDILHLRLVGDVDVDHFRVFVEIMEAGIPQFTRIYVLRDTRNGGFITAEARAYIAKQVLFDRVAAVVNYGASFRVRTVGTMLTKAIKLFNPSRRTPSMIFADSHAEAIAWIRRDRAAYP